MDNPVLSLNYFCASEAQFNQTQSQNMQPAYNL